MATADDLRFGRKKPRKNISPFERHVHYQGTWTYGSRERYMQAVKERLKALKALSQWKGYD